MFFVRNGEVSLAVDVFGKGPPFLFAHSLSSNRQHARRELVSLADRHELIVFDLRGHGESTRLTEPRLYDPAAMGEDIAAILDHLAIERAIVGGESTGATAAMEFARRNPERVQALLLVAPAFGEEPNPDRQRLLDLGEEIRGEGFEGFLANSAERLRTRFGQPAEVVAEIGAIHRTHDPISLAAAFSSMPNWSVSEGLSVLTERDTPVGLVAWEGDPTHPIALARRIAAACPGARLTTLDTPMALFAKPEIVGRALSDLLDSFLRSDRHA